MLDLYNGHGHQHTRLRHAFHLSIAHGSSTHSSAKLSKNKHTRAAIVNQVQEVEIVDSVVPNPDTKLIFMPSF